MDFKIQMSLQFFSERRFRGPVSVLHANIGRRQFVQNAHGFGTLVGRPVRIYK